MRQTWPIEQPTFEPVLMVQTPHNYLVMQRPFSPTFILIMAVFMLTALIALVSAAILVINYLRPPV